MERLAVQPQLAEQAYRAILDAICSGRLAPGERLTQEQLAERWRSPASRFCRPFFCSSARDFSRDRSPRAHGRADRPGFHRASLRGEKRPRRAGRPLPPPRGMPRGTARPGRRSSGGAGEPARSRLHAAMIAADMAFHRFPVRAVGNPLIAETAALHWQHIRRVMGGCCSAPARPEDIWDEHAAILAAVASRRCRAGERLARLQPRRAAQALSRDARARRETAGRSDAERRQEGSDAMNFAAQLARVRRTGLSLPAEPVLAEEMALLNGEVPGSSRSSARRSCARRAPRRRAPPSCANLERGVRTAGAPSAAGRAGRCSCSAPTALHAPVQDQRQGRLRRRRLAVAPGLRDLAQRRRMPEPRAMNIALFLAEVNEFNGPLMFIPGATGSAA